MGRRSWWLVASALLVVACGGDDRRGGGGGGGADVGGEGGGVAGVDAGLLPFPCDPGELELADGTCQAAGIPELRCPVGFVADGRSGCEPVLPATACPDGAMAVPGEDMCRPVAPCGDGGPWDGIPVDGATQYVDPAFAGASDGSANAPWTTIDAALAAATPGAVIALAPGTYVGNVVIAGSPVKLWGKCPTEVTLETNNQAAAVLVQAAGTEIHRLGITGNGTALSIQDATALAEQIWIHDVSWIGAYVEMPLGAPTALTLADSLIENVENHAVYTSGGSLTFERSVARDVAPYDEQNGFGVQAVYDDASSTRPEVTIVGSVIERVHRSGLRLYAGDALVTATVFRDVAPTAADQTLGAGVYASGSVSEVAKVTLDGVSTARTHWGGVVMLGGELVAERVTVRDVATPAGDIGSLGVAALSVMVGQRASATLREISVADVDYLGVAVSGADASLEGIAVEDMRPYGMQSVAGTAVLIESDLGDQRSMATFEGLRIERALSLGMAVSSSDATGESLWVSDVAPNAALEVAGRGISVEVSGSPAGLGGVLGLTHAYIARVHEAGVAVLGSQATLISVGVEDVAAPPKASVFNQGVGSHGIVVQRSYENGAPATATLEHVVVQRVGTVGVMVTGADATLGHSIVVEIGGGADFGDGLDVAAFLENVDDPSSVLPGSVTVSESLIGDAQRAGIAMFASQATLQDVLLSCNDIHINGENYGESPFELAVDDVRCVCEGAIQSCKVLGAGLQPPPAL